MSKHKRLRRRVTLSKPARPKVAADPEIGRLNYKALVEDRRKSRERDEAMLRRGALTREELQRRNSMIPPGATIRILSLPEYCIEPD
jgi:hypothetical protein